MSWTSPVRKSTCVSMSTAARSSSARRSSAATDEPQLDVAEQRRESLRHVEVGREVVALGDDHPAAGPQPQRAGEQLEDVHRRRVGDRHLGRCGADEAARSLAATRAGRSIQPGLVPARARGPGPTRRRRRRARAPSRGGAARRASCRRGRRRRRAGRTRRERARADRTSSIAAASARVSAGMRRILRLEPDLVNAGPGMRRFDSRPDPRGPLGAPTAPARRALAAAAATRSMEPRRLKDADAALDHVRHGKARYRVVLAA